MLPIPSIWHGNGYLMTILAIYTCSRTVAPNRYDEHKVIFIDLQLEQSWGVSVLAVQPDHVKHQRDAITE